VADNNEELNAVIFGRGFAGGITDIETGPDGNLYILTLSGDLYRLVRGAPPSQSRRLSYKTKSCLIKLILGAVDAGLSPNKIYSAAS
jgi:hypothetical protein